MTYSTSCTPFIRVLACSLFCIGSAYALPQPATATTAVTTQTPTKPPLRQVDTTPAEPTLEENNVLIQQHQQELAKLKQHIQALEHANQQTLADNQTLQLDNDNLGVQVQVLQSERSAQMFIYGAVTFACGLIMGLIVYSFIYTRRRRSPW